MGKDALTDREIALIKAARETQRNEDATALELAAQDLATMGYRRTADALLVAAASIRAGT